jgi:hypothetical protein
MRYSQKSDAIRKTSQFQFLLVFFAISLKLYEDSVLVSLMIIEVFDTQSNFIHVEHSFCKIITNHNEMT